jgi:UDP-glucuronate 4-epimerase
MKILVTGAAGFIGYHTSKRLLSEGHEIVGLDNINDYYDVELKYSRLEDLGVKVDENTRRRGSGTAPSIESEKYTNLKFTKLDLEDTENISKLFETENFDKVIHLAAQAGVRYSIENPRAYIDSNIVGFLNILEGCRHNNVKHLIYASSSSVYGDSPEFPLKESLRVDNPISLYAATKKSNELMAYCYSHLYKFKTTGLRFFTVYGTYGRPDMFLFLLAEAIRTEGIIKVFNNGDMFRDFTYVDDVVEGIKRISQDENLKEVEKSEVYNIGRGNTERLGDFISLVEKYMGREANKEYLGMQPGDVQKTYADTSKLNNDYGYKPKVSIEEGVKGFVEWYKSYNGI